MIRKLEIGLASLLLATAVGVGFAPISAYANKVDCGKVMSEVSAGKTASAIAKDLNISTSSVYRCKKKAGVSKSTGTKSASAASPAAASTKSTSH